MKITGAGTLENERADTVTFAYIGLALEEIAKSIEELKTSNSPMQVLLGHIQMLIEVIKVYPYNISGRLKKSEINEWQECFNAWFERVESKIPSQYRDGIKSDSERLFAKLKAYGHEIEWL